MARRILALIVLGLALIVCVVLAASESLTNRTGRTATAVTVTFSEQVRITSYDEAVFPTKDPLTRSDTFRFSGGELENGARFSVSWTPSTAEITNTEWETTGAAMGASARSDPLTYEEIMAQIAHYPGPDEPLYVPAENEQVWLTDLEGHADIYDNDSIKINYAPGFDKSQITRISVYRNGVKLGFVPALFDVLTNDQMKTFDGNPEEHSPKSSHTDHAIMGYSYSFRFYKAPSINPSAILVAKIRSGVTWQPAKRYVFIGKWYEALEKGWVDDYALAEYMRRVSAAGFNGISVVIEYSFATQRSSDVLVVSRIDDDLMRDPCTGNSVARFRTPTRAELERVLAAARDASLGIDLRIIIYTPGVCGFDCNVPSNMSAFADTYASLLIEQLADLCNQYAVNYLMPFTEMTSLELHSTEVRSFYTQIDAAFGGRLGFEEAHNELGTGPRSCTESYVTFEQRASDLWTWQDSQGRPLGIQWSGWPGPFETQNDQRLSVLVQGFANHWQRARDYYRSRFPTNELTFGELGVYAGDGVGQGRSFADQQSSVADEQETADMWAAYLIGCMALGIDGFVAWELPLWGVDRQYDFWPGSFSLLTGSPAFRIISGIIGP